MLAELLTGEFGKIFVPQSSDVQYTDFIIKITIITSSDDIQPSTLLSG